MIAWERYGQGDTPDRIGVKGDHLVGDYYVKFNDVYKQEMAKMIDDGMDEKTAEKEAPIMREAQDLLRRWEAGDKDVRSLWQMMNGWVYKGFDETYKKLGISFDKLYYESDTYLLGKKIVEDGLRKGVLYKKEDGSVWVDLKDEGLDEKLLLRGDGTSVYMTQDLGTAKLKYDEYRLNQSVYVIADEQNYHIQVLKLILKKLGEPCANGIYHLSYGMVELPTGRMKSREGTVVDADDMIDEMIRLAQEQTEQSGKTDGFSQEELLKLYETIGLGALKFYLLRVDPKKKMIFDPKESIDLHGYTATFIQYAHARICSILRKENVALVPDCTKFQSFTQKSDLLPLEKKIILSLEEYPGILEEAAVEFNPSSICNYSFQLAQQFNTFYDAHSISKAESEEKKQLRLMIIVMTASVLRHAMHLMGIKMPEKM
jgi:arginyl-tRNA synthetase